MTVYRELAAELRANKAVIDSLNSRNQQLLNQNQMLKQEIHNVVQATLSMGQAAGIARQASMDTGNSGFSSALTGALSDHTSERSAASERSAERWVPNTLARLARGESQAVPEAPYEPPMPPAYQQPYQQQAVPQAMPQAMPQTPRSPSAAPATPRNRVPRPIAQKPAQKQMSPSAKAAAQEARDASSRGTARQQATNPRQQTFRPTEMNASKGVMTQPSKQKLFTEKSGEYRSTALDASENKEIGGIWLALSIILIIVTAFGAGFLIMKPLLNDR